MMDTTGTTRFRFCLPSPGQLDRSRGASESAQTPNPFPLIADLRETRTLLPIKTFWAPIPELGRGQVDRVDWYLLASHESVHLFLTNTLLGSYITNLIHAQYSTIYHTVRSREKIGIPSLQEPSGILARIQEALDLVDVPVAIIHELFAVAIVRCLADVDVLWLTGQQLELLAYASYGTSSEDAGDSIDPDQFYCVRAPEGYAQRVREAERESWLPYYGQMFDEYNFVQQYGRLLAAFRQMARHLANPYDVAFLLGNLACYPFDMLPVERSAALTYSIDTMIEYWISFLSRRHGEPLKRLDALLAVLEIAPGFDTRAKWQAFLIAELPEIDLRALGERSVADFTHQLWTTHGLKTFAEPCRLVYSRPLVGWMMTSIEIPDNDWSADPVVSAFSFLLVLESMRQSLLVGSGVVCLCPTARRTQCIVRRLLARFHQYVEPDPGYEEWFALQWHEPACNV